MNKQTGSALLFIVSFLVLIILQSYYVYNAYVLQKKELNQQVKTIASEVLVQLEKYETEASEDALILSLKKLSSSKQFMNQKLTERKKWYAFKNYYEKQVDSILAKQSSGTGLEIGLRSEIYSVIDENSKAELLKPGSSLVLFRTQAPVSNGIVFTEGKWDTNFSERNTELKVDEHYHYTIRSRTSAELLNITVLIIKKIFPLSSVSLAIMVLLTYLFWRTQKNLRLQQLKVNELYTSIDSIAHELNTPITTLKFTVAAMPANDSKKLMERQIQRLENVAASVYRGSSDSKLFSLAELEAFTADLQSRFGQVKLSITIQYRDNQTLPKNDFEQILNNLVENSVKYKATEVKVQLRFEKCIIIEVSDNGIGIPEEAQPYVFDKYYRVSRPENLQIHGLGLGLHLVKTIVDKYRGLIKLTSNAANGVTFNISLPNA
ncbi:HAMP domain-containing sensor histidine kinase [Pedobacter sp. SYP-B3415]|uniref:sensor histidine kinase n=1 Tax=Pedobacter sp. SYP-B3415 TaxID=2496641 RepID=UPI00101D21AC|nr:HAMP domain-containing sensor histidine kinase [Pedobacter sp. SYP-B3415]